MEKALLRNGAVSTGQSYESWTLPHTKYRNQLQMVYNSKYQVKQASF